MKRIVGAAIIAVAAFGGAGAFDDNTVRDESGAIIEGGGLGAFAVQTGDCFNIPEEELIQSLEAVPCSQPHDAEAFDSFKQSGDTWPGQDAVSEASAWGCYERFETFVGIPWDESELDFWYLEPTRESWEEGDDREVICAITSFDGSPLVGSMQGARR
jgi:hypothetical protein